MVSYKEQESKVRKVPQKSETSGEEYRCSKMKTNQPMLFGNPTCKPLEFYTSGADVIIEPPPSNLRKLQFRELVF